MKLFLLSAFFLIAAVSCKTLRPNGHHKRHAEKPYVVTAPKIFLGEESVCLTFFDEESVPNDATLQVQVQSLDGQILHQAEEQLTSGSFTGN